IEHVGVDIDELLVQSAAVFWQHSRHQPSITKEAVHRVERDNSVLNVVGDILKIGRVWIDAAVNTADTDDGGRAGKVQIACGAVNWHERNVLPEKAQILPLAGARCRGIV